MSQDIRPHLAFMVCIPPIRNITFLKMRYRKAHDPLTGDPVGAIVCKQDSHRGKVERGYIAMLVVGGNWRKRGIGERHKMACLTLNKPHAARKLVQLSIDAMLANGADEVRQQIW